MDHRAHKFWYMRLQTGYTDTVSESALCGGEKKTLPHREIEPVSAACRSDALPTKLHPHPEGFVCKIGGLYPDMK